MPKLRMRAHGPVQTAQAAPDEPNHDVPPGDSAPPIAPDANAPAAPAASAEAPTAAPEATLTDAELAKLSEAEAKTEVIVVTGSTLDRRELTTSAPVTVLDRQDLDGSGRTAVGDIIQKSPDQSGINAQTNNGNTGGTRIDIAVSVPIHAGAAQRPPLRARRRRRTRRWTSTIRSR